MSSYAVLPQSFVIKAVSSEPLKPEHEEYIVLTKLQWKLDDHSDRPQGNPGGKVVPN
jgi:hypothetical protein